MKILILAGTRPDIIKIFPVYTALSKEEGIETLLIQSGQHDTLADQAYHTFYLAPDRYIYITHQEKQRLGTLNAALISEFTYLFEREKPDLVLVHGDTVTAFSGACAAFQANIPIGHIEAGLRTSRFEYPFPEEGYRRAISRFTTLHFAPTSKSAWNLREEGIINHVHVTGNTVVDSLQYILNKHVTNRVKLRLRPYLLVTCHRRESYGQPLIDLCRTLNKLKGIDIIWPVHSNPVVYDIVKAHVDNSKIMLVEPQDYATFIITLKNATTCITDSGGVMEEAAVLGVPTLVLRTETERPEILYLANIQLIGYNFTQLEKQIKVWLDYPPPTELSTAFGDGTAGQIITNIIVRYFRNKQETWKKET